MKQAMRAKDSGVLDVLRMVKTQAQLRKSEPGFKGETDDAFWKDVIARYVKQQKKALLEFEKAGEQGREGASKLRFEIEYLSPFIPKLKGEDEVRELVRRAIAETGAVGAKMVGRIIGHVIKSHKDEVDAEMVKRVATEELG
jgi:uncharacterized protein YqeY